MTPEQILAIEPRVLTQAQREFYFNEGYLLVPGVIDPDWLALCDRRVTIPMRPGAESLNVAMAGAIIGFKVFRDQRSNQKR